MTRFASMSPLRTVLATVVAAVAFASASGIATAAPVPAGTNVFGTLSTDLNSKDVNVGDGFSLTVVPPYPNGDASYAGAVIHGHVVNVVRAGQGRKAEIGLAFDRIFLTNGQTATVSGHAVQVSQTKSADSTLAKAAGAGIGMLVGNYIGKHLGTNLGGLVGAAGGFVYANNLKSNVTIPKGATVTVQLDQTLSPGLRQNGHYSH